MTSDAYLTAEARARVEIDRQLAACRPRDPHPTHLVEHGVTGFLCGTVDEMAAAGERVGALSPAVCRRRAKERFSGAAMAAGYERVFDRVGARSPDTAVAATQ